MTQNGRVARPETKGLDLLDHLSAGIDGKILRKTMKHHNSLALEAKRISQAFPYLRFCVAMAAAPYWRH